MPRTLGNQGEHQDAKLTMVEQEARSASMPVATASMIVFASKFAVRE